MKILEITVTIATVVVAGLVWFSGRTARRVERQLPPMGRFIDVPQARLHVFEKGSGPALLLIHGLAGSMGHFTYGMVDLLAKTHRVVVVDRPGSGYSTRAAGADTRLQTQADAMAALITELQLDRPVVVGHSMGGAIALSLAQRHPHLVRGLALIAPLTLLPPEEELSPAFKALVIESSTLRHSIGWTLAVPASIQRTEKTLQIVFAPEPVPADFATRGGGLLGLRPSQFIAASTDLVSTPDSLPEIEAGYAAMQTPVRVLYAREDNILNAKQQGEDFVARVSDCQITLVEGGHMLPITQVELTADFVQQAAISFA
jgi:pimeloyl-ACP methyl ester carboxylesterase